MLWHAMNYILNNQNLVVLVYLHSGVWGVACDREK